MDDLYFVIKMLLVFAAISLVGKVVGAIISKWVDGVGSHRKKLREDYLSESTEDLLDRLRSLEAGWIHDIVIMDLLHERDADNPNFHDALRFICEFGSGNSKTKAKAMLDEYAL